MRKSTTDRMNDYDAVVMGVLEPILVLSVIYEERLRLLDIANGYRDDAVRVGALRSSTEVTASRRSISASPAWTVRAFIGS